LYFLYCIFTYYLFFLILYIYILFYFLFFGNTTTCHLWREFFSLIWTLY
ncbi:unnamed protein product, partial [Brassica oleracea var. botrytis]